MRAYAVAIMWDAVERAAAGHIVITEPGAAFKKVMQTQKELEAIDEKLDAAYDAHEKALAALNALKRDKARLRAVHEENTYDFSTECCYAEEKAKRRRL